MASENLVWVPHKSQVSRAIVKVWGRGGDEKACGWAHKRKEKQQTLCHKNGVSPRCPKRQDTEDFKHSKVEMKNCKNATKKEVLT